MSKVRYRGDLMHEALAQGHSMTEWRQLREGGYRPPTQYEGWESSCRACGLAMHYIVAPDGVREVGRAPREACTR